MDGVHRLCRDRDIPPLDGRAMLRCERAEGRRDMAVALCDSGEEGLRYLLFFKSGCRGRARGLQKLIGAKVKVLLLDEPRCERYAPSSRSRSALGVMKCAVSPVSVATQVHWRLQAHWRGHLSACTS